MLPSQRPEESVDAIPPEIRARVMEAVLDELSRWGVERFSVEALAERHQLDAAMIFHYWGDRQLLIVDAARADVEALSLATDTGSLRGDLMGLARCIADRLSTNAGRTLVRALAIDRGGYHDEETRMKYWAARFAVVRGVMDRAQGTR